MPSSSTISPGKAGRVTPGSDMALVPAWLRTRPHDRAAAFVARYAEP